MQRKKLTVPIAMSLLKEEIQNYTSHHDNTNCYFLQGYSCDPNDKCYVGTHSAWDKMKLGIWNNNTKTSRKERLKKKKKT